MSLYNELKESYENESEVLLCVANALASVPVFPFEPTYTLAHVAIGRYFFLKDQKGPDLSFYGLLWDVARMYCGHTTIHQGIMKPKYDEAFEELIEYFGLPAIKIADRIPILVYDSRWVTGKDEYLREAEYAIGMPTVSIKSIMNILDGMLKDVERNRNN